MDQLLEEPKWLTPIEMRSCVTGARLNDDLARLADGRADAYTDYMNAVAWAAPAHTVEEFRRRVDRFDEARQQVTARAERLVIDCAVKTAVIGFGYTDANASRALIRPHQWHFLALDFESARATGSGAIFVGVTFVLTKGAPRYFLRGIRDLLSATSGPAPVARAKLTDATPDQIMAAVLAVVQRNPKGYNATKIRRPVTDHLEALGLYATNTQIEEAFADPQFRDYHNRKGRPSKTRI